MRVSVVIPTLNAGSEITRLIEKLRAQKPHAPDEIVAIDSGSKDDTCQRVIDAGGRVVEWKQPFNHGLTRDAGIAVATGEIVCLTVQDAVPCSDDWLATMTSHFQDPQVAGVSSRQVPPPDGPVELQIKAQLEAEANGGMPQRISLSQHPDYAQYSADQKLALYRFDNVCSSIRKSVWERVPFGDCRYAEDFIWARGALEAGFTLIHDPAAPVIHAHRRTFIYEFRRALLDAWVLDDVFGFRYSLMKKLNRAKALVAGQSRAKPKVGVLAKLGAVKTYTAHVLARSSYGVYRCCLKPVGLGRGILVNLTRGI